MPTISDFEKKYQEIQNEIQSSFPHNINTAKFACIFLLEDYAGYQLQMDGYDGIRIRLKQEASPSFLDSFLGFFSKKTPSPQPVVKPPHADTIHQLLQTEIDEYQQITLKTDITSWMRAVSEANRQIMSDYDSDDDFAPNGVVFSEEEERTMKMQCSHDLVLSLLTHLKKTLGADVEIAENSDLANCLTAISNQTQVNYFEIPLDNEVQNTPSI